MVYHTKPNYPHRCENLRTVSMSVEHVKIVLKKAISTEESKQEITYTRLLSLLLAVWAEARLKKLMEEWSAFTPLEYAFIQGPGNRNSQFDRWKNIIDLSFSKHYSIPITHLNVNNLSADKYEIFCKLNEILGKDLKPIIEIRNKLAHGEWIHTFGSSGKNLTPNYKAILDSENYLTLNSKQALIHAFADLIHDLATSKPTFERDFMKNWKIIKDTKARMTKGKSYSEFTKQLVESYSRGKIKRNKNAVSEL